MPPKTWRAKARFSRLLSLGTGASYSSRCPVISSDQIWIAIVRSDKLNVLGNPPNEVRQLLVSDGRSASAAAAPPKPRRVEWSQLAGRWVPIDGYPQRCRGFSDSFIEIGPKEVGFLEVACTIASIGRVSDVRFTASLRCKDHSMLGDPKIPPGKMVGAFEFADGRLKYKDEYRDGTYAKCS